MSDTTSKTPEVGDIWEDADPRAMFKRRIRVAAISDGVAECANVDTGRKSRVQLSRFKPTRTGYRFVGRAKR